MPDNNLGQVLFMTNNASTFVARSVMSAMEDRGLEVELAPIDSFFIDGDPGVFFLLSENFMEATNPIFLADLKRFCTDNNKRVVLLGLPDENSVVKAVLSREVIAREIVRPIESFEVAELVEEALQNPAGPKKHVMVVDDSGVVLRTMMTWLEVDYRVSLANSALRAKESIAKDRPDLILLDYDMPVCSGAQFLAMLRNDPETADIPVVFLTSKQDAESVKAVVSLKPQGYLLKSLPKEQILEKVKIEIG